MRLIPLLVAALLVCAGSASAATVARPAALSPQDKADVQRIEAYFDTVHTMASKFLQLSDNGGMAEGKVYLSRPGKMRFEYDPPTPLLMVANDGILAYYDLRMQEESNVPLSATPVALLLRDHVSLAGDVTVTKFERDAGTVRVTLQATKDPAQGSLTLVFSDQPLQLKQWIVLDAQNTTTKVTLIDPQYGARVDSKLFNFVNPREARPGN